jgi:hypothetical protein
VSRFFTVHSGVGQRSAISVILASYTHGEVFSKCKVSDGLTIRLDIELGLLAAKWLCVSFYVNGIQFAL